MNGMCEAIEDFEEVEKLGKGFSSTDPLEHKDAIIKLLKEYVDYFAWNYREMPGLN
jgi:hypothetical protein